MTIETTENSNAPSPTRDLRQTRSQLTAEREALIADMRARRGEIPSGPTGVSDGSGETEHLTVAEQEELSLHLDRIAESAIEDIQAALARLDNGTYGICVQCQQPIGAERLEAMPAAAFCMECQQRYG